MDTAVVLLSGGLDSSTAAYLMKDRGYHVKALSFDYGQRHNREIQASRQIARQLGITFDLVDISSIGRLLGGSALTDMSIDVPEGHYAAPTMKLTVVPNRNAIMLSIAYGIAASWQARTVVAAFHAGDHHIYPSL